MQSAPASSPLLHSTRFGATKKTPNQRVPRLPRPTTSLLHVSSVLYTGVAGGRGRRPRPSEHVRAGVQTKRAERKHTGATPAQENTQERSEATHTRSSTSTIGTSTVHVLRSARWQALSDKSQNSKAQAQAKGHQHCKNQLLRSKRRDQRERSAAEEPPANESYIILSIDRRLLQPVAGSAQQWPPRASIAAPEPSRHSPS